MGDIYEYIEDYFKEQLSDTEKKLFEERCVQDEVFARQVASYITIAEGVRQKLLDQKRLEWRVNANKNEDKLITSLNKLGIRKWLPYASAACIITFCRHLFSLSIAEATPTCNHIY